MKERHSLVRTHPEDGLFDNLRLLSVEDLADAFGRSPKTIRNWVARREIPFVIIRGRVQFFEESIEAWLKKMEYKPWQ